MASGHPVTKKTRANSNSAQSSFFAGSGSAQATVTAKDSSECLPSLYSEISNIMRGFGDCEQPLKESVILIERILVQQLRGIIHAAADLAVDRKGYPEPSQRDIELLMSKHPGKIFRLQKHLKDLYLRKRIRGMIAGRPASPDDEDKDKSTSLEDSESEELIEKFDEEKTRRMFRADRISQSLGGAEYQEFNEARRTSFYCRNAQVIKTKLKERLHLSQEIRLSGSFYTILAFLAHETIAAIVDFSILSRLDSSNRIADPFGRLTAPGSTYTMLHLCPEVTQGRGADGVKPITVQEIQEAMRRHVIISTKHLGRFRNMRQPPSTPFLAL